MVRTNKLNATTGLCPTCNNLPTCVFFATRGPVHTCELFEDYQPPRRPNPRKTEECQSRSIAAMTSEALDNVLALTGLCVNCELRHVCTFPAPPGGVWRCEEYV
jgi:hypothetical protein